MAMLSQRVKDIGGWVLRDMIMLELKFSLDTGNFLGRGSALLSCSWILPVKPMGTLPVIVLCYLL